MTPSERDAALKIVSIWLDSAGDQKSSDHQLILTREGVTLSKVNKEPIGVGISFRASTNVTMMSLSLNKIVAPETGIVIASPVAPAEGVSSTPTPS